MPVQRAGCRSPGRSRQPPYSMRTHTNAKLTPKLKNTRNKSQSTRNRSDSLPGRPIHPPGLSSRRRSGPTLVWDSPQALPSAEVPRVDFTPRPSQMSPCRPLVPPPRVGPCHGSRPCTVPSPSVPARSLLALWRCTSRFCNSELPVPKAERCRLKGAQLALMVLEVHKGAPPGPFRSRHFDDVDAPYWPNWLKGQPQVGFACFIRQVSYKRSVLFVSPRCSVVKPASAVRDLLCKGL